jgi:outer membrane protein assembly factor BamB
MRGPVLGPVSVANGVVFAAGGTSCVALDAATGAKLWEGDAAATIYGGIAISDGRVFFGDTLGNLYCHEIPR